MTETLTKPAVAARQKDAAAKQAEAQDAAQSALQSVPQSAPRPADSAAMPLPRKDEARSLWYDTRGFGALSESLRAALLARVTQGRFTGISFAAAELDQLAPQMAMLPARIVRVLQVDDDAQWQAVEARICRSGDSDTGKDGLPFWAVASADPGVLSRARARGFASVLRVRVDDAESLHRSIHLGRSHDVLVISFKDTTNIPLELVIAELHKTSTILLKETGSNVDDAVIALGVLELGSDGVLTAFREFADFDRFAARLDQALSHTLAIDEGIITGTRHLGLGYRACIDTTHLFAPNEGLLVGSTSGGGILCCPEVFHLPYMELRPFRVNAASVHSYIFLGDGRTAYISELRAGSSLTAIEQTGRTHEIHVGRVKTEIRPLILIEAESSGGRKINVIMQDDWHVRVFSHQCKPLNVTELKPGDRILGHWTEPGRHVGIKVDEHIIEA
jgi:3-amino-4-hydroxybenzoic acid synthase